MPGAQGSLSELFFVHYPGRRCHFSKGHPPFAAKCTKSELLDFSDNDFIFLTISISHISPLPLLHCIASSINAWKIVVQKNAILIKITPVLYFFCPLSVYFVSVDDSVREFLSNSSCVISLLLETVQLLKIVLIIRKASSVLCMRKNYTNDSTITHKYRYYQLALFID